MAAVADGPIADPMDVEVAAKGRRRRSLTPMKEARRTKVVKNLTDPTVIAEDELTLEKQYYGVFEAFQPRNRWQEWLTARVSTLMLRISRAERVERKLRDWASYRAFDFWEDDQRLAVEVLGEKLRRDPAKVAAKLRQSPAGLDWLVARWRMLADLGPEDWTDERRELACRLLGGDERVDPATPGFVAAQLEGLEADRAVASRRPTPSSAGSSSRT